MGTPVILIIEDERVIFHAVALLLRAVGYQVVHAPDSLSALVYLAANTPALVLIDLWIPVVGGRRLAYEIRRLHGAALPLVVTTAEYLSRDAVTALDAVGYLRKPYDLDEVLALVERIAPIHYDGTSAHC